MKLLIVFILLGLIFAGEIRHTRNYKRKGPRRRYRGRGRFNVYKKQRHGYHCDYKDKTKCKRWMKTYKCKKCYKYKKMWHHEKVNYVVPYKVKKCKRVGVHKKCKGGFRTVCKPKRKCWKKKGYFEKHWKKKCWREKDEKICKVGEPYVKCRRRYKWKVVGKKKICKRGRRRRICRKGHGVKKPESADYGYGDHHGDHHDGYGDHYGDHHYGHDNCYWKKGKKKCHYVPIRKRVTIKKCKKYPGRKKCYWKPGKIQCKRVMKKHWIPGYKKCKWERVCKEVGSPRKCWMTKGWLKCWYKTKFHKRSRMRKVRPYWKKIDTGKTTCKFLGNDGLGWTNHHGKCYHKKPYFGAKKK